MNRFNINSTLIKSIVNCNRNNQRLFLNSNKSILKNQLSSPSSFKEIKDYNKIFFRSFSTIPQDKKDKEKEEVYTDPFENEKPKQRKPFGQDLEKYMTNETIEDQKPEYLIYKSNKENALKGGKIFLTLQSVLGVSSPLIAYANSLDFKTVLFLSVFSFWALSFQMIGQKMISCFGMRIYREPNSPFIKLCHINPSMKVLKIPIEDIQSSKISDNGSPYCLLENGSLFFFERSGELTNSDEFAYIFSGEEYAKKMKKLEQEEYKKYFEDPTTSVEDLEHTSKLLDFELEAINKKIEDAKLQEKEDQKEINNEKK
ncbi:hypothetical protein RB653_009561 [Dictyostelium firmibasis]|uniref:Uncharacterized protein n=1 Tax=Dictyostelium firmibasis TaxID=79012 RepID=A0AAN7UEJ4_9MYCE